MEPKISKSEIQEYYRQALATGLDDWDARAAVIERLSSEEILYHISKSEYYFTIYTIWRLCER